MSIHCDLYRYDHPVVRKALDEAHGIIARWLDHGLSHGDEIRDRAVAAVTGWDGVYLAESIAAAILEARGFPIEDLCDELDAAPRGVAPTDVLAEFDRALGRAGRGEG